MAIDVVCACWNKMSVSVSHAGKRVRYPSCGGAVVVPLPFQETDVDLAQRTIGPAPAPQPPSVGPEVPSESQRLRDRIQSLESALRYQRLIVPLGLAVAILLAVTSLGLTIGRRAVATPVWDGGVPTSAAGEITARSFVLTDDHGVTRGEWKLDRDNGSLLSLNDTAGERTAVIRSTEAGECALTFFKDGIVRATLGLVEQGPALVFWDSVPGKKEPQPRLVATLEKTGLARLSLHAESWNGGINASALPDGALSFGLFQRKGPQDHGIERDAARYGLTLGRNGDLNMMLKASDSPRSLLFGVDGNGVPSVTQLDATGRPVGR